MKTILGGFLFTIGLMAIAGSVSDCDGKCMEYANSMGEMMIIMFYWVDISCHRWYNDL